MTWRSSASWAALQQRAALMRQIRQFFYQRGVLEVDTPSLSRHGVTDLHLDNMATQLSRDSDGKALRLFLQTSPEYAMKRLLAQYQCCIYQLSHVFRDDEIGRYHNPEFMMLEWYRVGFTLKQLISEVSDLLVDCLKAPPVQQISYQQAFLNSTGCDPLTPAGINDLHEQLKRRGDSGDWMKQETDTDTILQVAFNLLVEPKLPSQIPLAVTEFPASQAALAKISPQDERVALRFEIYYQGVELANGYDELTDATTQLSRFESDIQRRHENKKPEASVDQRLIEAIQHGLPECCGVALGFDRLLMIALDAPSIADIQPFSIQNC